MTPSRDIARLIEIMAALRTPGTGCPWDLEQNFATIAPYTHRGSLRGRRRDRARRSRRPARGTGRPPAAGRVPRPHGAGAGRVRLRRRGAGDHREADAAAPACVRRRARPDARTRSKVLWERIKAEEKAAQGRQAAPRKPRDGALAGVPVGAPCPHPRAEAAAEGRQGRLRLERPDGGAGEDPRGSGRDRGRAPRRRTRATPRPRSAISCSRSSISRAISMPIRRPCCARPTRNSSAASRAIERALAARGKTPAGFDARRDGRAVGRGEGGREVAAHSLHAGRAADIAGRRSAPHRRSGAFERSALPHHRDRLRQSLEIDLGLPRQHAAVRLEGKAGIVWRAIASDESVVSTIVLITSLRLSGARMNRNADGERAHVAHDRVLVRLRPGSPHRRHGVDEVRNRLGRETRAGD